MPRSKSVKEQMRQVSEDEEMQMQRMDSPTDSSTDGRRSKSFHRSPVEKPIFADADAMKEKIRQNMILPVYDVADFYHDTGLFQLIARSRPFENLTLGVIAMNAVYISIDTDHNKASSGLLASAVGFQVMEHFFCCYFSFEWFVRFMSFRRKRNGCRDSWFVFDSLMVIMMVGETWVMTIVLIFQGGGGGGGGMGNASMMRLLRLLRLSRMARMARLFRAMPELLILIKGMVSAMRSVFFTLLLQMIILYVFGITFTQLTDGFPCKEAYFSNVPASMHALLIYGTLMDNIGDMVDDLAKDSLIFPAVFYLFVLISALTVMNMLIGVLCEVVSAVASTERETLTVQYVKGKLQDILHSTGLDCDGDGMISKVEFAQVLENAQAARILSEVGVDVFGLVELSDFIFACDDNSEDPDGKQLSFGDFMEVILQLRGVNNATVKDIVDLRKFIKSMGKNIEDRVLACEDRIRKVYAKPPSMPTSQFETPPKKALKDTFSEADQLSRFCSETDSQRTYTRNVTKDEFSAVQAQTSGMPCHLCSNGPVTVESWQCSPQHAVAPNGNCACSICATKLSVGCSAPELLLAEESGAQGLNVASDISEALGEAQGSSSCSKGCAPAPMDRDKLLLIGLEQVKNYLGRLSEGFGRDLEASRSDVGRRAKEMSAATLAEMPVPAASLEDLYLPRLGNSYNMDWDIWPSPEPDVGLAELTAMVKPGGGSMASLAAALQGDQEMRSLPRSLPVSDLNVSPGAEMICAVNPDRRL